MSWDILQKDKLQYFLTKLKNKLDDKYNKTGGTIKASSGDGEVRIEGANNNSNYGQIKLVRNSKIATILPHDDISANRSYKLPNIEGTFIVGSNEFGHHVEFVPSAGVANPTWTTMLDGFRDSFLGDAASRRNIIRVSKLDDLSNLIFHCSRYVNANTSIWVCTIYTSGDGLIHYVINYSSNAANLRKITSSATTNMSNTSVPDNETIYLL